MHVSYSSTGNLLSPVPAPVWSIFCCGFLMLYQRNENVKNTNLTIKKTKAKKAYVNINLHSLF